MGDLRRARRLTAAWIAAWVITSPALAARPLTLAEALAGAAGGDETIGVADEELEEARAEVVDQAAGLLPTFDLSASRGQGGDQQLFQPGKDVEAVTDHTFWRAESMFSAPVLAPSDIGDLVAADREMRAQEETALATRHEVLFDVVRAYYEALWAHSGIQVAEASAEVARTLEDAAQRRLGAGTETQIEVDRARGDRIEAEGEAQAARFEALDADLVLAHAACVPLEALELSVPQRPAVPGASSHGRLALAREGRPDLRAHHWTSLAAASAVHAEALTLAPELQVRWSTRYTTYDPEDLSRPPHTWTLMLRADWQLPGILEPAAEIAQARAQQRRADLELQRAHRETELSVRSAEISLEASEAAVAVARERDGVADANLAAGMRLYEEGMATGLEVSTLKAERDAAAAELLGAALERDLAEVDLLEQLGVDPLEVYATR